MGTKVSKTGNHHVNKKGRKDKDKNPRETWPRPTSDIITMPNVYTGNLDKTASLPNPELPPRPRPSRPDKAKLPIVRAIYDYVSRYDDDIAFEKDDRMELISKGVGDDWWLAKHLKTKRQGYIPSNYVVIDDDSIESQDWWHSFDRNDAIKQLMLPGNPRGTFLVRNSSDKGAYALSILDHDNNLDQPIIRHFLIRKMDDGHSVYISTRKQFTSLIELVNFYRQSANAGNGLPCQLTMPCPREALPVPFKELDFKKSDIVLGEKLGAGQFGEVYAGKFRGVVDVAVKTVKLNAMTDQQFIDEAEIMHKLRHRRLVQLYGVCRSPLYIITERMSNGALLDYLRKDGGRSVSFELLIDMAAQVADGMSYLESKHFIHRDLRAANVLVGDRNVVKVADFGLARMLDSMYEGDDEIYHIDYERRPDAKFPIKWTAPEAFENGNFTVKSDVWSFGILLYEMVTYGRNPYPEMDNASVRDKVQTGYRMRNPHGGDVCCPDYLYQIMLNCWNQRPECRPTFESLKHTFEDYPVSSERQYSEQLVS